MECFDLARWIEAVATIGMFVATAALVVVGLFAARWARDAATAAVQALRLESEAVLLAGQASYSEDQIDWKGKLVWQSGKLLVLPTNALDQKGTGFVTIRNINGRAVAVNVTVSLRIVDVQVKDETTSSFFIQYLAPQDTFVYGIHNEAPSGYYVAVERAVMDSSSAPGKQAPATLYSSKALPVFLS